MGSGAILSLRSNKALHQTLQFEVLSVTAAPRLAWSQQKPPRKGHWTSTKTCRVLFLILHQSPLGNGVGGTGTAEQSRGRGSQGRAHVCALPDPWEGWTRSHRSTPQQKPLP